MLEIFKSILILTKLKNKGNKDNPYLLFYRARYYNINRFCRCIDFYHIILSNVKVFYHAIINNESGNRLLYVIEMKKMYSRLAFLMLEKDTKLSQRQLSRELDISLGTINKLYNGRPFNGRVDSEVVEKICQYFHCDISDLFELRNEAA